MILNRCSKRKRYVAPTSVVYTYAMVPLDTADTNLPHIPRRISLQSYPFPGKKQRRSENGGYIANPAARVHRQVPKSDPPSAGSTSLIPASGAPRNPPRPTRQPPTYKLSRCVGVMSPQHLYLRPPVSLSSRQGTAGQRQWSPEGCCSVARVWLLFQPTEFQRPCIARFIP